MDDGFIIAYDGEYLEEGIEYPVRLSFSRTPHIAISGQTGWGKTVLVKLIAFRVYQHYPDCEVIICDFKRDDFRYLDERGLPGYHSFMGCADGLDRFYRVFQEQQESNKPDRKFRLLIFDEWASYLNTINSTYFATARDQFSAIFALGNISKEAAQMFGFDKDRPPVYGVGAGYLLLHGAEQIAIQVPQIKDFKKLDESIIPLVSRPL